MSSKLPFVLAEDANDGLLNKLCIQFILYFIYEETNKKLNKSSLYWQIGREISGIGRSER